MDAVHTAAASPPTYELLLQNDVNSNGNTQWFFFKVLLPKNAPSRTVSFNIINFQKSGSLFNEGMRVSVFSEQLFARTSRGWFKGGDDLKYSKNHIQRSPDKFHFTLSFTYTFTADDDDVVYFAYSIPYTLTQLNRFINKCVSSQSTSKYIYRKSLTKTLAGNKVDLLTITNPENISRSPISSRKGIVITARVHPGETVSSHIMEGLIESLLRKPSYLMRCSGYLTHFLLRELKLIFVPP